MVQNFLYIKYQGSNSIYTNISLEDIESATNTICENFSFKNNSIDKQKIIDELIRRYSVWTAEPTIIKADSEHQSWLSTARKKNWVYWKNYKQLLASKWAESSIVELDRSTDQILDLLEDPLQEGIWARKGLVVGHVQSGKTAHYTGLICKAADAGYKIIVILAGMYNNLRSQTQIRLEEGFLGYKNCKNIEQHHEPIGVGLIDKDLTHIPNCATNRDEKGDFNTRSASTMAITPEERPWLFVVKKNKTVLKSLYEWFDKHVATTKNQATGRMTVSNLPLLMIDDEADNASVDTGEQFFDDEGKPDKNYEPKAINSLIRRILHLFDQSAYVGYTATPFANIFIHTDAETELEGPDLFPSAFIMNLAAPSNYIGPLRLFGSRINPDQELPLVKIVKDAEEWLPPNHKKSYVPSWQSAPQLPPSLQTAIFSFLLSCAVRYCRGQQNMHSSMLVHVTRFTHVQREVAHQVEDFLQHTRQRLLYKIDDQDILARLKGLWEEEDKNFVEINNRLRELVPNLVQDGLPSFSEVLDALFECIQDVVVMQVNGSAKDTLEYEKHKNTGLKVIAIGGEKLSRGLTLEGLCTSYFLRASRMYDTLMQMGRWFGYRSGYLDLCRLYTSEELVEWFRHITEANEELRDEFDHAVDIGMTPDKYGLKVLSHPSMMITSRLKMRNSTTLRLSFSGQFVQTVAFHSDSSIITQNYQAAKLFIEQMGTPAETGIDRERNGSCQHWEGCLWNNVEAEKILSFLNSYKTPSCAYRVDTGLLTDFIQQMNAKGELTEWTVAILGTQRGKQQHITDNISIGRPTRKFTYTGQDRISIRVLTSPNDESIDLDEAQWSSALETTKNNWHPDAARFKEQEQPQNPSGKSIREIKGLGDSSNNITPHPERGFLLLYLLEPKAGSVQSAYVDKDDGSSIPITAFAISFPESTKDTKVAYVVNNTFMEQDL